MEGYQASTKVATGGHYDVTPGTGIATDTACYRVNTRAWFGWDVTHVAVDDNGTNKPFRVKGNGTTRLEVGPATIGFYGATPVAKAANPGTVTGTDAAVINAIVTALRNLGLVT